MDYVFISEDNTTIGIRANSSIMGYILLYLLRMVKTKHLSFRFIYRDMKKKQSDHPDWNKYSFLDIIYLIILEKNILTTLYFIYFPTIDIWDLETIKHEYDNLFRNLDRIKIGLGMVDITID